MAVGKVSLDDWLLLTSSLGCTGFLEPSSPPTISMARLAMTSFTFMLLCVPEPVCQTTSGKWSSSFPAATSAAARATRSALSCGMRPSSALVMAAACLRMPNAWTTSSGMRSRSPPMAKNLRLRAVWAPQ